MGTTCRSDGKDQGNSTLVRQTQRFPEDLRTWLKGPTLVRLAHAVAQEHTASTLIPVFSLSARRFHHPWRMLAVLTYAYGSGIWHSRAISEISSLDPYLSEICHGEPPAPGMIRRFRRHNTAPLVRCLEHLLRRLWCQRNNSRMNEVPSLVAAEMICNAGWRLQRAEESDAAEYRTNITENKF